MPLTIARSALASNLQVDKPETVAVTNWWITPTLASVPIQISEAQGQQAQIYYPDPGALTLTTPDNRKLSATADRVEILQRNGAGELVPLPTPTSPRPGQQAMQTLAVNGDLDLVYRLTGLGRAGAYQGKVTIAGPDSAKVTQDITIEVRHGWLFPFLAILLGVLLSYYWHNWTKEGRSRALLGRDIAQTRESIEAIQGREDKDSTWGVLLRDLRNLEQQNRDQTVALAEAQQRLQDTQARKGYYSAGTVGLQPSRSTALGVSDISGVA